ncbi:MAG: PAS domain S-box protein [Proteobacteria bacterium]|nr:MAG: PAS domain S-box protein [Pseudomonadota bacterium]
MLQEQMLGALLLRTGHAVDDHLVAFFEVVASQLALVIGLTRSFEQLERMSRSERERAEVLASVIDAVGQPLVMVGTDGTPTLTNPAGEDSALFERLRAVGESAPQTFLRSDLTTPYVSTDLPTNRALRGESVTEEEVVVRHGDESAWMSVTARPIRGRAGEIRGAVAIARDVTEVKRMQSRQAASDRLATVGILAAGVAHEINNPLTCVMAELEMAIEDLPAGGRVVERLRAAHDAAARVQTIVKDLRTLSRKETESRHQVSMARVLETAGRMAAPQVRPCATFSLDLQHVPPVLANEPRLVQVFLNLIVNAAQAIGPGDPRQQRIVVRCRREDGEVIAEVSDSGPGMTPEIRARLFTPFFTTKPAGVGTGLGLSISQRIVTAAGGILECESSPGVGTTFRVRLPARVAIEKVESSADEPKPVLLVIEDDPLAWQLMRRALGETYELTQAPTAADALLLIGNTAVDYETILCATEHAIDLLPLLRQNFPHLEASVLLVGKPLPGDPVERPRLSKPHTGLALTAFVEDHRRHRELLKRGGALDRVPASR